MTRIKKTEFSVSFIGVIRVIRGSWLAAFLCELLCALCDSVVRFSLSRWLQRGSEGGAAVERRLTGEIATDVRCHACVRRPVREQRQQRLDCRCIAARRFERDHLVRAEALRSRRSTCRVSPLSGSPTTANSCIGPR